MLLRNVLKPALSCTEATGVSHEECVACARSAASQIRGGWLRIFGAPDYRAYLLHHAANHAGSDSAGSRCEHDRDRRGRMSGRFNEGRGRRDDDIDVHSDQIG